MEFVYASELKQSYQVWAHFYYLKIAKHRWLCRSVADIVASSAVAPKDSAVPQAIAVMMNPGSAKPSINAKPFMDGVMNASAVTNMSRRRLFDISQPRFKIQVAPDNAQYQLMRLMKRKQWSRLRIINLSDLCEGSSKDFPTLYRAVDLHDPSHPESLMHAKREEELDAHLQGISNVILAWGRQPVLAEAAIAFCQRVPTAVGLARDYPWYRFASPYRKDQKLSWLNEIESVL